MTPEERNVLQQFLGDLQQARGVAKDPEADGMIGNTLRSSPDAGYLLVQHAILADQALQVAQQRIAQLEQGAPAQPPSSFLGGGQPMRDDGGWNSPPPQPQPQPQSPLSPQSGLGGFLRSAGTMAAGVAGGEFLAQGLSNLFSPRDW